MKTKAKPKRKRSNKANVLFRESQAVRLRRVQPCEWTFEGEPKSERVGFDGALPLPWAARMMVRERGNSCFNQGGTADFVRPYYP